MKSIFNKNVLDETVFGRKCRVKLSSVWKKWFWTKVFLDEFFFSDG